MEKKNLTISYRVGVRVVQCNFFLALQSLWTRGLVAFLCRVVVGVLCFVLTVPFVVLRCEVMAILNCFCTKNRDWKVFSV